MKKLLLSLCAVIVTATASLAQIQTVKKPEVTSQSSQWKWSTTGLDVKYLADGKNDNRAAINVGEGLPLSRLVDNLPPTLGAFRVVPLVTFNASEAGSGPRSTMALIAPKFEVVSGFTLQPGVAFKGLMIDKSFDAVNGLQGYVGVSLDFDKLSRTTGLKRLLGL